MVSLGIHCATIGQNLVFLRGFSENSFACLIIVLVLVVVLVLSQPIMLTIQPVEVR